MRRLEARGIYAALSTGNLGDLFKVLLGKHIHYSIATDPDCDVLSVFGNRWRGPGLYGKVSPKSPGSCSLLVSPFERGASKVQLQYTDTC
jgi:hypothetical protein